jgi:hypothetical protein
MTVVDIPFQSKVQHLYKWTYLWIFAGEPWPCIQVQGALYWAGQNVERPNALKGSRTLRLQNNNTSRLPNNSGILSFVVEKSVCKKILKHAGTFLNARTGRR